MRNGKWREEAGKRCKFDSTFIKLTTKIKNMKSIASHNFSSFVKTMNALLIFQVERSGTQSFKSFLNDSFSNWQQLWWDQKNKRAEFSSGDLNVHFMFFSNESSFVSCTELKNYCSFVFRSPEFQNLLSKISQYVLLIAKFPVRNLSDQIAPPIQ